jgi:hypothetical protein
MGIRAVLIGDDLGVKWPDWLFKENTCLSLAFQNRCGPLVTHSETKGLLGYSEDLEDDIYNVIHKALKDAEFFHPLREDPYRVVVLEETGRTATVEFEEDKVTYFELVNKKEE